MSEVFREAHPPFEGAWGVFRVLLRTDGLWIVYDPRRELGKKTVKTFRNGKDAERAARLWHDQNYG